MTPPTESLVARELEARVVPVGPVLMVAAVSEAALTGVATEDAVPEAEAEACAEAVCEPEAAVELFDAGSEAEAEDDPAELTEILEFEGLPSSTIEPAEPDKSPYVYEPAGLAFTTVRLWMVIM